MTWVVKLAYQLFLCLALVQTILGVYLIPSGTASGDTTSSIDLSYVSLGFTFVYFNTTITRVSLWQDGQVYLLQSTNIGTNGNNIGVYYIDNGYSGSFSYRTIGSSSEIANISAQIRSASSNYADFVATDAFVVTWLNNPSSSDSTLLNSFQLILACDSALSFLVYNYQSLNQTSTDDPSFFISPNSSKTSFNASINATNGVTPGQFVFRVDGGQDYATYFNTKESALINSLLSGYNKNVRPLSAQNKAGFLVSFTDIATLSGSAQTMTTSFNIYAYWNDGRLAYDPSQYSYQQSVLIPASSIWVPDLAIINSVGSTVLLVPGSSINAIVQYDGTVNLVFSVSNMVTACDINVSKFPFDKQSCPVSISSWALSSNILNTTANQTMVDINFLSSNTVWDYDSYGVTVTYSQNRYAYYLASYAPVMTVNVYLNLRRRPLYYMIADVVPCLILNLLNILAFALPSASQFGLAITIFLTYTVTLVRVSSDTPVQSLQMTLFSLYFIISQLLTLITLAWFVIENLFRTYAYMPSFMTLFGKLLRKLKCKCKCCKKKSDKQPKDEENQPSQNEPQAEGNQETSHNGNEADKNEKKSGDEFSSLPAQSFVIENENKPNSPPASKADKNEEFKNSEETDALIEQDDMDRDKIRQERYKKKEEMRQLAREKRMQEREQRRREYEQKVEKEQRAKREKEEADKEALKAKKEEIDKNLLAINRFLCILYVAIVTIFNLIVWLYLSLS